MPNIRQFDRKSWPLLMKCLDLCSFFSALQLKAFEGAFATYCECRYGIGVSTGTSALALALRACDIGPGDEVITVANSFIASIEAIALVGATPVFVDIDPETYTMNWHKLEEVLTPRTRAILPVHLYGYPVDMEPITTFARKHELRVIEDASQAHGATYRGKRVGGLGDIGCFSLYYSKNLGAYGEAGICVTNDENLAERLCMLRDHGSRIRYEHEMLGVNARMDEIQAAVLNVKLRFLNEWNAARQSHAQAYTEQLRDLVLAVPVVRPGMTHVFYVYVVQVPERDAFCQTIKNDGVSTGIYYPIPLHLQQACRQYGYRCGMLPVTEAAAGRIVSLPMYPELTIEQRQVVIEAVKKWCELRVCRRQK